MAKDYRPVDRDQVFLVAPDMRDWLPKDHPVWFLLDVVAQLDTTALHRKNRRGGVGRRGFDPDMLLTVLLYAYLTGVLSSRRIELACSTDVAFRVACAQDPPDHTTIARFRQTSADVMPALFAQVLELCGKAGLGDFGTVAIDGTKIAANASMSANRRRSSLELKAAELLARAEAVDAAEDDAEAANPRPPADPDWVDPARRVEKIRQALAEIAAAEQTKDDRARGDRVQRAEARLAAAEHALAELVQHVDLRFAAQQAKIAAVGGRAGMGRFGLVLPADRNATVAKARRRVEKNQQRLDVARTARRKPSKVGNPDPFANLTDPQSRVMPTRHGLIQGYNAQLAVTADGLIVAATLTQDTVDMFCYQPMVTAAQHAADHIAAATGTPRDVGTILADAGYCSTANITAPGPDRLIAVGKHHAITTDADAAGPTTRSPDGPSVIGQMAIQVAARHDTYKRRGATVEPRNAHLKDRRGLRRFSRRGLTAANAELTLAALVTNLATHRGRQATA